MTKCKRCLASNKTVGRVKPLASKEGRHSDTEEFASKALDLQQDHFQASLWYDEYDAHLSFKHTYPKETLCSDLFLLRIAK